MRAFNAAVIMAGAAYLLLVGWAMQSLSYDIWGAFVIVPVLVIISTPLIGRAFSGDLAFLRPWAWAGLFIKFAGAIIGYSVRFDAYGGNADAARYHVVGKVLAGDVRSGLASPFAVLPSGTGTRFVEELTGLAYTIFGSSRLGGFMVFSCFSFWGLVLLVKAAHIAIPAFATRRYLIAVFLFPSLIYWGSSIGKEAIVGFFLGVAAFGAALVLTRQSRTTFGAGLTLFGLIGAAFVRPHFAAIWAGGILVALVARVMLDAMRRSDTGGDERRRVQASSIVLLGIAVVGFAIIATVTLNFLPSAADDDSSTSDQFSSIFETAEDRTTTGGSAFNPISVNNPRDWPYAVYRTITRPLLNEANGIAAMLPALEMTALLFVGVFSWRRLVNAPKLMLTTPYVVFAALCVFTFGVAFSSIGNLGILVRQRSLILPLVLVFWCLPPIVFASERARSTSAMESPADKAPTS